MEESLRMKNHVKTVAIIQIIRSSLWLLGSIGAFMGLSIALGVVEDPVAEKVLGIIIVTVPVFFGLFAVLGLTGGIGLLAYKNWARIMTLITAGMGCLIIPIGTLIGVYSIWVLMQDATIKLFDNQ